MLSLLAVRHKNYGAAGVSDKLWDIHGIVELVEALCAEQAAEKKEAMRQRIEQPYSPTGDALGGKGVHSKNVRHFEIKQNHDILFYESSLTDQH